MLEQIPTLGILLEFIIFRYSKGMKPGLPASSPGSCVVGCTPGQSDRVYSR